MSDLIIDGINISAMQRNFDKMKDIVVKQSNSIGSLQEEVRRLKIIVSKKEDSTSGLMQDWFDGLVKK